jgi:hypothetical protein
MAQPRPQCQAIRRTDPQSANDAKTQQGKFSEWQQQRSDTSPLGDWFRRMKGKIGPRGAIVATQIGSHHLQNDDRQNTFSRRWRTNNDVQRLIQKTEKKLAALKQRAAA